MVHINDTTSFLYGLRRESGGYAESPDGEHSIRSTLSVVKALIELGKIPPDTTEDLPWAVDFVLACRDSSGGFAIKPGDEPAPYDTANGLICLKNLGRLKLLEQFLAPGLAFMGQAAQTQFDHFMLVATYEECEVSDPVPQRTIDFFSERLISSVDDKKVADTAIAAASLIRAGHKLPNPAAVAPLLLSGQNDSGGFNELGAEGASLFITYCALRTLVLLDKLPNTKGLSGWLASLKTDCGYTDVPGGTTKAGPTYMNIGMQAWVKMQQGIPVEMARRADVAGLEQWLKNGGMPDIRDSDGWTVLLAASARGQSAVVDLLLNHAMPGAEYADPDVRFLEADALPIYFAGQSGDLDTIKLLLEARPAHLHEICGVNGHTVLLQTAFYGAEKHLTAAEHLLEAAADEAEREKLLCATNVRGYTALDMQDLWHNEKMKNLLLRYYPSETDKKQRLEDMRKRYYDSLLLKIASPEALTEKVLSEIGAYLSDGDAHAKARIEEILKLPQFDIDLLGGPLLMTPLIFALTGKDESDPERADRRRDIAKKLLDAGASVTKREKHPMGVGAVIRASVLNNFNLLQLLSEYMTSEDFAKELNVSPAVNGLTAMHDAVHRALTSPEGELQNHIDQIEWMILRGARLDIQDHTGQTAYELAESALKDKAFPRGNVQKVWEAVQNKRRLS